MLLMGSWELVKLVHRAKPGQVLTRLEMEPAAPVPASCAFVRNLGSLDAHDDAELRCEIASAPVAKVGHPSVQVAHRIAPSQQILGTAQWIIGHAGTCSPAFHRMRASQNGRP
eukprot:gene10862-16978_t